MTETLTVAQAAATLGVSRGRILQLIRERRLPAAKPGRDYQIQPADLLLPAVAVRKRTGRPRKG